MLSLRESVPGLKRDTKYLELFDEFVRECEFGLALGLLCDFLLEPNSPPVRSDDLDRIWSLRALMRLDDANIEKLMRKTDMAGQGGS